MTAPEDLDAKLESSLVGGLEPRKVEIVDYDPGWPARFAAERDVLIRAFGDRAIRVEHIGSTAVPGLGAKPIVDILVTVQKVSEPDLVPVIEPLGFELRVREPDHLAFRRPDRSVNLHIYADDDEEVTRYLVFRERLRRDPGDRALYERTKRELAAREWRDVNYYADAKSAVVEAIIARALTAT